MIFPFFLIHAFPWFFADPLSPMLFLLGVDVLNRIISWIDYQGSLTDLGCNAMRFWASLYVDNLVLFVAPRMHAGSHGFEDMLGHFWCSKHQVCSLIIWINVWLHHSTARGQELYYSGSASPVLQDWRFSLGVPFSSVLKLHRRG